ncbi:hypothetical protein [Halorussus marinus]|uniref:hypothetical protein n=1 Tax=Halorussus marinus TaxID=2505976 RepID=UPI00106E229F|nr:hypothetical protein [Halorussus marinus]
MAGVDITFQILYGIFSAALGAVFIEFLSKVRLRIRIKRALYRELETNQDILSDQIEKIEPVSCWDGRTTESFHTDAYTALRVNDPALFFKLRERWPILFDIYKDFDYLNTVRDTTLVGEIPIPEEDREEFLNNLKEHRDTVDCLRENLDDEWFRHVMNAPIHEMADIRDIGQSGED